MESEPTRRGAFAVVSAAASAVVGACSPLGAFNALAPRDRGARLAARDLAYGDHPRQRFDVYVPDAPAARSAPTLIYFYGGSWSSGSKDLYRWVGAAFASQGFVTVLADYRLVPEFRFPAFVDDGAAAAAEARRVVGRYGGDPDRLLLGGHSAGAYIAVQLALDAARLDAAGVDPRHVKGAAGLAGPYDFYPFDVPASQAAFGHWPDPAETQPINFARPDAPALFLATGDRDETVLPRHSVRLAEKQRSLGAPAELKVYPGLDHIDIVLALSRPLRGKAPVLADAVSFLSGAAYA
jgi:acetyl esterase/lipase